MTNQEEQLRKQMQAKDSLNTAKLEQALAQQNQDNEEESFVDEEGAREVLQRSWLGKVMQEKPETNEDGEVVGYKTVWVPVSQKPKMNEKGFASLWGTILPYLTRAAQMSYMREKNIEKMLKATVRDLWLEILENFEEYEINPSNARQITDEALVLMMAAINKSRDGRGLVNKERTIVKKISSMISDEDESGSGSIFGMPGL